MKLTPHFTLAELNCKCSACKGKTPPGEIFNNLVRLANTLEVLREELKKPMYIDSGYRCKAHNTKIGGATQSAHLTGEAADWHVNGMTEEQMFEIAAKMSVKNIPRKPKGIFTGVGYYKGKGFCHVDISKKKPRPNTWSM